MNRTALLTALTATAALGLSAPALAAPPNDAIASATELTTLNPAAKYYTLSQATKEGAEVSAPAAAGHTVWYRWTPDDVGAASADVCGVASGTHHVRAYRLPNGDAATIANLVSVFTTPNDNPIKSTTCRARFRTVTNATYYLQVDRSVDAPYGNEIDVDLDLEGPPAPVMEQPSPITGPLTALKFTSGGDTVVTVCRINGKIGKPCTSGTVLSELAGGHTTAQLIAFDANGNFSTKEVFKQWTVDAAAPKTAITAPPATVAHDAQPKIAFSVADEHPGSSSACRIDGGELEPCASPYRMPVLGAGKHTLAVRSTDVAGNAETEAVTASYTVLEGPKPVVPVQPVKIEQPSVTPPPVPCALTLKAPKSVKRSALKRGLKRAVKLDVKTTGPCTATVAMKRRGGKVSVVVTAGSLKRTASVKVR